MRCPNCQADNPDTSVFCKLCGVRLAPSGPPSDEQRARQLVEEAFRLSDEGRLAQAITVCKRAVAANPNSTSAYSLLGILYERAGQRELAIPAYEAALRLSPESVADRESLQQLISPPTPEEARAEAPPPRVPAGPTVLAPAPAPRPRAARIPAVMWYAVTLLTVALIVLLVVLLVATVRMWQSGSRQSRPAVEQTPNPASPAATVGAAPAPARVLPAPMREAAPLLPAPPPAVAPAPPATARREPVRAESVAAAPTPPEPSSPETASVTITIPAPDTFVLRSPSPPQGPAPMSPAQPAAPAPTSETARMRYFAGDLPGAIGLYEGVVADKAKAAPQTYQELAWLYYRAGRAGDAAAAYRESLQRYQQQLAAGNDVDAARHGIRTSEAALRVLEME